MSEGTSQFADRQLTFLHCGLAAAVETYAAYEAWLCCENSSFLLLLWLVLLITEKRIIAECYRLSDYLMSSFQSTNMKCYLIIALLFITWITWSVINIFSLQSRYRCIPCDWLFLLCCVVSLSSPVVTSFLRLTGVIWQQYGKTFTV